MVCNSNLAKRPILFCGSLNGRDSVSRDDLWAVTTEELNEIESILSIYRHVHKARWITVGDEDRLTDMCDECGLDIRHEIHSGKK